MLSLAERVGAGFLALLCIGSLGTDEARAQTDRTRIRVGELTCSGGPSVGLIVGSRQDLRCTFRSFSSGRRYAYAGRMSRIGVDLGFTSGSRLFWLVFSAPTTRIRQGTLAGNYVGVSGDISLGLGAGANILVGGFNRSITLQPVSIQGQVGINFAAGVANLTLR